MALGVGAGRKGTPSRSSKRRCEKGREKAEEKTGEDGPPFGKRFTGRRVRARRRPVVQSGAALVLSSRLVREVDTYSPCTRHTRADTRANRHRPRPPRALENGTRNRARDNAVGRVVFATQRANGAVGAVVDQRDDARAVAQEGTPPRHRVEDAVEAQPRRHAGWVLLQALAEPPGAADGQRGQVADARAVAEVVGPAAAGQRRVVDRRAVLEREVVERVLVEPREGM